jgi:deoxyribodipyrimidine photo-lyase
MVPEPLPSSASPGDASILSGAPAGAPLIVWFRRDLRLADNPALSFAGRSGRPIIPIYVHDRAPEAARKAGGASLWWLAGSLKVLHDALADRGGGLVVTEGRAGEIIPAVAAATGAAGVVWNRRYDRAGQNEDAAIKSALKQSGVHAQSFNSHLLNEPWEVTGKAGGPIRVFTPYWRAARGRGGPVAPEPAPQTLAFGAFAGARSMTVESLRLRPMKPDWASGFSGEWMPGEAGARQALGRFLESGARNYGDNRNRPDLASTSRLSPHLAFGEISPRQVWHATKAAFESGHTPAKQSDIDKFLAEVGWREFSYHLLHIFPTLATENFQPRFNAFPWRDDAAAFKAWTAGKTGYPIVDAGMRQLWRIGWMHNRVRMITASFLIKHLLIDWRKGEEWFWDTLVDADPASNAASWQWVAGSGADAAPYFRIFAPVLQGEKFDPNGGYVREFVPELAKLPKQFIHKPWEAPHPVLADAGITLGRDYPHPIVVHEAARARALAAFRTITAGTED